MKQRLLAAVMALFTVSVLHAVELIPTQELFASYLEKDSDLKNLALELQKVKLNQQSTQLDQGFYIKLTTGDMTLSFGDNGAFTVKPGVSATLPQYKNLGLNVNGQLSIADGKTTFDNASAKVSVDIISANSAQRDVTLLKAERNVLEAERNLTSRAAEKEKTFYKNFSSLLSSILDIVSKKNSLIDDYNAFEKVKLEGYAVTAPAYIKAEMAVKSSEYEVNAAVHSLITNYKMFYLDCGYEIDIPEDTDFTLLIPNDIPQVEAVNINEYNPEKYGEIEQALWSQKLNQLSRDGESRFTLSANGGYSVRNENSSYINSIDAGVSAGYDGLSLNAGVSVPVAKSSPSVSLGITYVPTTSKKNEINEQLTQITIEQEKMKIDAAWSSYEAAVREKQIKLNDIKWAEQSNQKNYEMYAAVEKNMLDYYNRGLISEKDYTSAVINTLQTRVKGIMNRIDLIVYNDEVKAMFVE